MQPVLEQLDDADASNRGCDTQVSGAADADGEPRLWLDPKHFPVAFELPRRSQPAAREAPQDARISQQIARVVRPAVPVEERW